MMYLLLLLLVHYSYAYRTTYTVVPENKRQVPDDYDVACFQAYVNLTADEKSVLIKWLATTKAMIMDQVMDQARTS